MKKTKAVTALMKDCGIRIPFLWEIVSENGHFLHVRNWIAGKNRVISK